MAVTWYIGSGGDYPTFGDAKIAMWNAYVADNLYFQTNGDHTLIQISDIVETTGILGVTPISYGAKLTYTSDKVHKGVEADAWKLQINTGLWSTLFGLHFARIEVTNFWLELLTAVSGISAPAVGFRVLATYILESMVKNNVVDMKGLDGTGIACSGSGGSTFASRKMEIWNNIVKNTADSASGYGMSIAGGSTGNFGVDSQTIENNSIEGKGYGISNLVLSPTVFRNNASINTGSVRECFRFAADAESYNNASSDDTADDAVVQSGNLINVVGANEFSSITPSDPDFFVPLITGQMPTGGQTVTIPDNTEGLGGNARPWSDPDAGLGGNTIGAFEYPSTPPAPPPSGSETIESIYSDVTDHLTYISGFLSEFNGGIRALLYSYGGELRVFETNKCYRFSPNPKQGKNWSEYGGPGWIWPEAKVSGVRVFTDKDQPMVIVMDAVTGLFYHLASRSGPAGSGLTKLFKDKVGAEYAPGESIPWIVRLKEHIGSSEENIVRHIESHIFLRPEEESNQGASGYDENGYLSGQEITVKAYKNGEISETAKTENIPYKGDIVFDKDVEDNRVQIEINGSESAIKMVGAKTAYELKDQRGAPSERFMEEGDYQLEMCEPIHWLSRGYDLTLDRASGSKPDSGSIFSSITGPDSEEDSAMLFSNTSNLEYLNSSVINGDFTVQFAVDNILSTTEMVRFADDGIIRITVVGDEYFVEYEDASGIYSQAMTWDGDEWVFIKISRSGGTIYFSENGSRISSQLLSSVNILSGNIQYLTGNSKSLFDIRIYDEVISDGAFAYYRDNVINNNGNAFLCY